ncbi:MAG: hypothetical protein LC667_10585 [Thioalkalivibrio sp.]|nr:hypothetical protein [Thioalkalivibrio sp.]
MSTKPRLLLLDAGAVFAALEYECWDALVDCYEVVIGAVVVRVEAIFYTSRHGERIEIDLPAEVARGRVREIEMSAQQVEEVRRMFTPEFRERIDDGELEAIAYLLENPREEIRLVSGDGPAIQAVAMVDDESRAMSLAEALEYCGRTKNLPHQHSRDFTRQNLAEGSMRRIQGRGLQ